jgi:hypothetical protein
MEVYRHEEYYRFGDRRSSECNPMDNGQWKNGCGIHDGVTTDTVSKFQSAVVVMLGWWTYARIFRDNEGFWLFLGRLRILIFHQVCLLGVMIPQLQRDNGM